MIIAFTGLAGSGKSTAAELLVQEASEAGIRVDRASFADPLKAMLGEIYVWHSKDERPPILNGLSVRQALQKLADALKELFGPDLFVKLMAQRLDDLEAMGVKHVVIDDLRFDNEAELIGRRLGRSMIVRVVRPGVDRLDHVSESGISSHWPNDYVLNPHPEWTDEQNRRNRFAKTLRQCVLPALIDAHDELGGHFNEDAAENHPPGLVAAPEQTTTPCRELVNDRTSRGQEGNLSEVAKQTWEALCPERRPWGELEPAAQEEWCRMADVMRQVMAAHAKPTYEAPFVVFARALTEELAAHDRPPVPPHKGYIYAKHGKLDSIATSQEWLDVARFEPKEQRWYIGAHGDSCFHYALRAGSDIARRNGLEGGAQ